MVFTGTRAGMTPDQAGALTAWLQQAARLYNGCCHGADEECLLLARTFCSPDLWIEGFPGNQAQAERVHAVDLKHPVPQGQHPELARNRTMLRKALRIGNPLLVATPKLGSEEGRGSGTWATIRYARSLNIPRRIIWPTGRVDEDLRRPMRTCDARYRDLQYVWQPCQAPATEQVIVHGIVFEYCASHVQQFINVLPAGSWTREPLAPGQAGC